jgi:CBS domain-containing protein
MKASDVMTRDLVTATPDMTLESALALMVEHRLSGLPVTDNSGALVGMFTEGDLLRRAEIGTESKPSWLAAVFLPGRAAANYVRAHARVIGDLMRWPVIEVSPDAPLAEIVGLMQANGIKRVPIVEDGRLVGIVSRADLLKALLVGLSRDSGGALSDAEIQRNIRAEIAALEWAPRFDIDVSVKNGLVDLLGVVPDERERAALRVLAANAAGVKGVRDQLICVEPISGAVMDSPR